MNSKIKTTFLVLLLYLISQNIGVFWL